MILVLYCTYWFSYISASICRAREKEVAGNGYLDTHWYHRGMSGALSVSTIEDFFFFFKKNPS